MTNRDSLTNIKKFIEDNKDNSVIFTLASEMFREQKLDPEIILTHVIIYQYNQLKTQDLILNKLEDAA